MVKTTLDGIEFNLRNMQNFEWLQKYGKAFMVIDETGSGCLCVGLESDSRKVFVKIAGANTMDSTLTVSESVEVLARSVVICQDLEHANLPKILEHYQYLNYYVVVYEWIEGECLFDHWNFDNYAANKSIKSPAVRFKELDENWKLQTVEMLFSFLGNVASNNYVAVDFYEGSIIYDFDNHKPMICDVDLFRKVPASNDIGEDFHGTKRLKSPEEYILGATICEQTNVFGLGAMLFDFFGEFSAKQISKRYENNEFLPCSFSKWELSKESYLVALKSTQPNVADRYSSIAEFSRAWNAALGNINATNVRL